MSLRKFIIHYNFILFGVYAFFCTGNNAFAEEVFKCTINGKTSYQSRPCPENAKAKAVDTSGKDTKDLGKDFAKSAKEDKIKLEAIEKEKAKKAAEEAAALSDKPQMPQTPQVRNLALERIEKFFTGK